MAPGSSETLAHVAAHPGRDASAARRARQRPDSTLVPGTRVSSWKVEHELGRGGMASVHAVVHTKFGKRAAIKIAHDTLGAQLSSATFWREARIVHAVDHPAVIDVFATGSSAGRPYLVMERLVGVTLGRRIDVGPPLERSEALGHLLEVCDVLRAAHAAGIVHRDIKLDNVFLCDTPFAAGRRIKLLDWGVARIEGEADPFQDLIAGTLTYVAPEQIRGDAIDPRADIYSLAVLAYHLLCRRPPFAATSDLALLQLHLRAEPPRPSVAWPDMPDELEALLVGMLAKDPDARPSLDEVEAGLRAARDRLAPPHPRLAEGSRPHIAVPPPATTQATGSAWLRWLMVKRVAPDPAALAPTSPHEVLGPRLLPVPSLSPSWVVLATLAAGLAALVSALS